MATNLVSLVMQFLTPDMIARIAAALGLDRVNTQTAAGAAVPALLAGLGGVATKRGRAQTLADAVKQQTGVLDDFASMVDSGGQSSLVDKGSNLLSSLLGGADQTALTGAIAKFSGLGQGASGSLLGMLAPVVMGTIGKQFGARGPDAGALADLFTSQRSQIAQAMPAGFGKLLSDTRLLDSIGGMADTAAGQATKAATGATAQTAHLASSAANSAGNAGQRVGGGATSAVPNWAYWAVPLAVIIGLGWWMLSDRSDQAPQTATPATRPAATTGAAVGGVDIGRQLGDSIGSLRASLQDITDEASARAALPKLQEVTRQVDRVTNLQAQFSSEQRKVVTGVVSPAMVSLNQLFDRVLAIPGVGEVLKPTINSLRTKLTTLMA